MTDEQIKQNAEAYADKAAPITEQKRGIPLAIHTAAEVAYLAGAHSRDREVMDLEHLLKAERTTNKVLAESNEKLRNPWISVEERLPQESKKYKGWLSDIVFVITNKNDGTSARYDHATKTWCPAKILQGSITHWMPILEVKKGE